MFVFVNGSSSDRDTDPSPPPSAEVRHSGEEVKASLDAFSGLFEDTEQHCGNKQQTLSLSLAAWRGVLWDREPICFP